MWHHTYGNHSDSKREREMFYLTTHSTHFIYGYMASDIWLRTILIARQETRCHHYMSYFSWLAATDLLYAPSHRQGSTYHSLCYTSHGALVGTRNSSNGPPWRIDPTTHHTMSRLSTTELYLIWSMIAARFKTFFNYANYIIPLYLRRTSGIRL